MAPSVPAESENGAGLPQPSESDSQPYRYVLFDQIEEEYFPNGLNPETLCWVLLSKGKGKGPKLSSRARVLSQCEEGERILMRYPKGSTYRVRRSLLMPVLEHESNLILVTSETNDYRRTAIVHTRQEDHFLEIGCDFGVLVDSVDAQSRVGVDKSEESIKIAKERYPSCDFLLGDIFQDLDIRPTNPVVVAMDINGNRELPAVSKCLQLILDKWAPRLVVVKSRELYAKLANAYSYQ